MIAYLQGQVLEVESVSAILNVKGVGYEVACSTHTLEALTEGQMAQLYIHTHVREDLIQLFGFNQKLEKQLFLSLIKVNGIGPKMAVQILSAASTKRLAEMIDQGDVKGLTGLPKVGKKTAEQMILSLKGKLVQDAPAAASKPSPVRTEVISALVNLGFRLSDVEVVVKGLPEEVDFQTGVREGLSQLTNPF